MEQRDQNVENGLNSCNANQYCGKRWRRRVLSPFTAIYLAISMFCGSMALLSLLLGGIGWPQVFNLWPFAAFKAVIAFSWHPLLFVLFALLAAGTEVFSYLRFPPPVWRVKNELTAALVDVGILNPYDVESWRGVYHVAPFGKFNWGARSFELLFDVASVKANDERLKMLQENLPIAGFHRAQEVVIEHYKTAKGNRLCFKLTVWYSAAPTSVEVF